MIEEVIRTVIPLPCWMMRRTLLVAVVEGGTMDQVNLSIIMGEEGVDLATSVVTIPLQQHHPPVHIIVQHLDQNQSHEWVADL